MTAKQLAEVLLNLGTCEEARTWAKNKSLATVWKTCRRGDWLLWLCGKMADKSGWPTRQEVVLATCACAELALKYVPDGETRPAKAIEIARRWANGLATIQEVRAAAASAAAASFAADASFAASAASAAAWKSVV